MHRTPMHQDTSNISQQWVHQVKCLSFSLGENQRVLRLGNGGYTNASMMPPPHPAGKQQPYANYSQQQQAG